MSQIRFYPGGQRCCEYARSTRGYCRFGYHKSIRTVVRALVEVKLIDAATGESFVHSSFQPGMATFSDMNRIAAAVDSAAKDVLACPQ